MTSQASGNATYGLVTVGNANGERGTLTIGDGLGSQVGVTASNGFLIGNNTGATGNVTVRGSSSVLTVSQYMKVGNLGSGTLTMTDGASGSVSGYIYIVDNSSNPNESGSGTLSLSGTGTSLTMEGLSMRNVGVNTSTVRITNGAVLDNKLGFYAVGNTTIVVSGTGSELRVGTRTSQQVTWGNADGWFSPDDGQIEVSGGALLDTDGSYIGGSGTATMVVTGSGTRWLNGLPLYIGGTGNGNTGNGTVTVSNGAYVRASTSAVGVDTGAVGTLTITGSGTIYEVLPNSAAGALGNFRAGFNGNGTVTVSDGAQLKAANQINIATNSGSVGVINIGAAEGSAAAAAGTLDGGNLGVVFGSGNATLVFNHTNTNYVFNQAMSGPGATLKHLAGVTHLTGNSSGLTANASVSGGQLLADADLSGTTFNVSGTGSLGGTGTVGAVTIGSGSILSGTQGSGLTMSALNMNAGASMNVTLGAPSSTGVFTVNGNVTLNGSLNITAAAGFSTGLYRIVNYSGTLTDNGFAIGTKPSGSEGTLQTSTAGQVNLVVNSEGGATQFWNGTTTSSTGTLVGGSGTWTAGSTKNWSNQDGNMSLAWTPTFAIFQAAAGTVTVDTSAGAVSATGMQFVTSGYTVSGGAITLTNTARIRVGDGTGAGASTTARIDSVLAGTAGLDKADLGTLVLTGANTYTGGTTVSAGTLQIGNGGSTGSISGNVTNNGTLAFNRSDDIAFSGVISGSGALAQKGTGTLTLTGDNTYTGGTTISAGTLQIGNGGTAGSISGNVTNNGTLAFNRTDDVTFSGVISGSGTLVQKGTGTLTLTGDNTFTGVTTISSGALQIGNGGVTGSIVGDVVNNATLIFNRSDSYQFGGRITGSGAVIFKGGTVLFSAPYNGSVSIDSSIVQLQAGTTTSSPFTIGTGGILGGSATIGSLTANNGGTVAPGYSPGTITVNGPVTFNAGSVYAAEVTAQGDSDLIAATGTATISQGAILRVSKYGTGTYGVTSTYTVLTATGGISGRFILTGDTRLSAFYDLDAEYSVNAVRLRAVQTRSFASVAQTPNQRATARSLDGLAGNNALRNAIGASQTEATARAGYDQLSGELYATLKTGLIDDSRMVRDATLARLDQAGRGAQAVWMRGYGTSGWLSGDGNAIEADRTSQGMYIGADAELNDMVRLGVVGGYGRLNLSLEEGRGSGSVDTYSLGVYGSGQWDAFGVSFGANHAWHDISTIRSVSLTGLSNALSSDSSDRTTQIYGEANYAIAAGGMDFKPFAGLAYVNLNSGSFAETGGAAALSGSGSTTEAVISSLGVRASRTFDLGGTEITANGMLAWHHDLNNAAPTSTNSFGGGGAFVVSGLDGARDIAGIEAGFSAALSPSATFNLNFNGQYGSGVANHGVNASLSLKF